MDAQITPPMEEFEHRIRNAADSELQTGPVLHQCGDVLADPAIDLGRRQRVVPWQVAIGRGPGRQPVEGTAVWPCVLGMRALISASTIPAVSTAARAVSTLVPSEQTLWRSGGESWTIAASSRTRPLVKRPGMSERKIGTKSARPSATGSRRPAPVKSEIDRKR